MFWLVNLYSLLVEIRFAKLIHFPGCKNLLFFVPISDNLCRICDEQSDIGSYLLQCISTFTCHYQSTRTPNWFFHVPSSSSVGATARCGLWPVEQYLSICSYLSPTLSIFSLPSTWRSLSTSSLHPFLGLPLRLVPSNSSVQIFLGHPILLHSLQVTQQTWVKTTRYCKYSPVLLMMGENIARNMYSWLGIIN